MFAKPIGTVFSGQRSTVFVFWLLAILAVALPAGATANTLLVMGDSLSAAYGVETDTAWVNLLRKRLDEKGRDNWQVVNASISGETTDGGVRRLPDLLDKHQPDIVIIELGGNDGLRGFQPPVIRDNLSAMIEASKNAGARVLLVGMQIPPNYGPRYTRLFADMYPELSDQYDTALVPFFLDGIYNGDNLMQNDGIHPTGEAQPRLLDNVWPHLEPLLEETTAASR
ncbi:arylesterase [Marinobacter zhanjiangensis]|uniref:Arylesterase n=1 Tax=Marinobacter zhanjiangensis TaxID=578215 RepID=A0ABQ3AS61_9GAMM|nr:arylesterase [Marinobacter zhanjiangensis]GGY65571.1 arylesterase [Marinobacter zhanjiangensis]